MNNGLVQRSVALKPPRFVGYHASPAAPHSNSIGPREHIVPARGTQGAGEPRKEGYASQLHVEANSSESIVEFESVNEVDSTSAGIIRSTVGVSVCRKEELDSVNRVKDDIIEEQNLVKFDAVVVDGCKGSVTDFGEECNALETLFAGG